MTTVAEKLAPAFKEIRAIDARTCPKCHGTGTEHSGDGDPENCHTCFNCDGYGVKHNPKGMMDTLNKAVNDLITEAGDDEDKLLAIYNAIHRMIINV